MAKLLPILVSLRRSTWGSNPFVRASYCYESVNSSIDLLDTKQLWEPLIVSEQDTQWQQVISVKLTY